jgi:hypothetical protein
MVDSFGSQCHRENELRVLEDNFDRVTDLRLSAFIGRRKLRQQEPLFIRYVDAGVVLEFAYLRHLACESRQ